MDPSLTCSTMAGMGFPPNLTSSREGCLLPISSPHALLGSSGSLLHVLQLLTIVPHLGKALVHQLDGHVLSDLGVVACSADQENAALAEMKKDGIDIG